MVPISVSYESRNRYARDIENDEQELFTGGIYLLMETINTFWYEHG